MDLYTFHTDYLASNEDEARHRAMVYAEGLNLLRPEVDTRSARTSIATDWGAARAVYCNAPGPMPEEACTDEARHGGRHSWQEAIMHHRAVRARLQTLVPPDGPREVLAGRASV